MIEIINLTVQDLDAAYEKSIDMEDTDTVDYLQYQLEKATRKLLGKCPTLARRIAAGTVNIDTVKDVVLDAVLRVVRDEDPSIKSESEGGYSYSKNALAVSPNLWFPDGDLEAIGCTASDSFIGSGRVKPRRPWAGWMA
ncbi:Gp19/Gp15/Gp42 family protein [Kocuria sp.]|uniref:Gp19/Gp15/Gp42 family protein n=1 Tax=Kocuria sp. TaxID=1871328 RepID=UPI0026DFDBF7|nr:Gp19/Gp15/Gp42 family protein [Kocuria sp.]MDO5619275.1 Gp19/Gp15/Gp42 family protein [Kocuria sp.]